MSRNKTARFAAMATFSNVFQPPLGKDEIFAQKGKWNSEVFKNSNPVVLELGCGKGEYTVGLASAFANKNYIGIDIKGSRMFVGAKTAINNKLSNAAFLRTRIELIENFFNPAEVDEIWITFPDPQPKKRWTKKRLTSSHFINKYLSILKPEAVLHLKTDCTFLYYYTLALLQKNNVRVLEHSDDVHHTQILDEIHNICTHYENLFMEQGQKITYIKWQKPDKPLIELDDETYQTIEEQYLRPALQG